MRAERQKIVISAVNLVEGGTLSILQDCLAYAAGDLSKRFQIIALVNQKSLFNFPQIDFIEFPHAKQSWFYRIYHEYWLFRTLSKKLNAELWLSLHDMTPNVSAKRLAVYCHNPAPFYSLTLKEAWIEPIFWIFNLFYQWIYWINIKKNDYVIVQQHWMKFKFQSMFNLQNIVVAHPEVTKRPHSRIRLIKDKNFHSFLYPALPRVFKNFEVICEASKKLIEQGVKNFEVIMTIDGSENRYAKSIVKRYNNISQLKFIGRQNRKKIYDLYQSIDYLVFPSKLETWGLPISEAKNFNLPILVADCPYAHETIGRYKKVKFFDPSDVNSLHNVMKIAITKKIEFDKSHKYKMLKPNTKNWEELFSLMTKP